MGCLNYSLSFVADNIVTSFVYISYSKIFHMHKTFGIVTLQCTLHYLQ